MPEYAAHLLRLVDECTPRLLGLPEEAVRGRPAPDKWSPAEILGQPAPGPMTAVPPEVRDRPRTGHNFDVIAWRPIPADEPASLGWFMADYVGHLEHHLRQILGEDLGRGATGQVTAPADG